jgi:hypothetical protein
MALPFATIMGRMRRGADAAASEAPNFDRGILPNFDKGMLPTSTRRMKPGDETLESC